MRDARVPEEEKEKHLGLPPIRVAAGSSGTWVARLHAIFSSAPAMVATIAIALSVSVFGVRDIRGRSQEGGISPAAGRLYAGTMRNPSYDPSLVKGLPTDRRTPSALELARRANAGALGGAEEGGQSGGPGAGAAAGQAADSPGKPPRSPTGAQGGKLSGRYGRLSTGLDKGVSGLNGGTGLSGGFAQPFSGPSMENSLLAKLKAMAAGFRGKTSASVRGAAFKGGTSAQRLSSMNMAMAGARGANSEAQSAVHTRAWANAGGVPILGAGDSEGAIDVRGAGEPGSGIGEIPTDPVPSVSPASVPSPQAPSDKTPDQGLIDMATLLLTAATAMTMMAFFLGMAAKAGAPMLYAVAKGLSLAAAALAGVVALFGLVILVRGNPLQGTIFLGVGGLVTFMALLAADGYVKAAQAQAEAQRLAASIGRT